MKQEAMRKRTLEHEMELRAQADSKRIEAETAARAKVCFSGFPFFLQIGHLTGGQIFSFEKREILRSF